MCGKENKLNFLLPDHLTDITRPSDPQFLSTKNFKILSMHIPKPK